LRGKAWTPEESFNASWAGGKSAVFDVPLPIEDAENAGNVGASCVQAAHGQPDCPWFSRTVAFYVRLI
jgi:hypothetical protein